jgi:hypothetical protein
MTLHGESCLAPASFGKGLQELTPPPPPPPPPTHPPTHPSPPTFGCWPREVPSHGNQGPVVACCKSWLAYKDDLMKGLPSYRGCNHFVEGSGQGRCYIGKSHSGCGCRYLKGRWSGGRYGGFFVAQIPIMVLERVAYSQLR